MSDKIIIKNSKTHEIIKTLSLSEFKKTGLTLNGYKITLENYYSHAVVQDNKLSEGNNDNANPALEIKITKDGKSTRDILYAKYPEFSIRKDNSIGMDFSYQTSLMAEPTNESSTEKTSENISENTQVESQPKSRLGNTIEFYVNPKNLKQARVELYKNQKLVGKEWLKPGQIYQTPWMGITITIGAIVEKAQMHDNIVEISPEKGKELPPSAILVKLKNSEDKIWFSEGESRDLNYNNRSLTIFYGRQIVELPFSVALEKFSKINYPGTETPLSFESIVHINQTEAPVKISMNEPHKQNSYTLYQSSYILNPGQTPVSIFSVNKDPGRPIKYLGSLILCLGIITFTLMRSRYGKSKKN
jgi:hypothetical protein